MAPRSLSLWVVLPLLGLIGCIRATQPQMNFLLAYSEVQMEKQATSFEPVVHDEGGGLFSFGGDAAVRRTTSNGSSLRLGGRLLMSYYSEDISERIVAGEPQLEIEEFVDLGLFSPQVVVSYRQILGDRKRGAFIEPGLGLGLSVGYLLFGSEFQFGDDPIGVDYGEDEWEIGFGLSPFLRGGVTFDRVLVGIEGGYQWSTVEFDAPLGEQPSEWYAGVFVVVPLGPPSPP